MAKSDERRYVHTNFFTFLEPTSNFRKDFFDKLLESSKRAKETNVEHYEHGKDLKGFLKKEAKMYITLSDQAIESIEALLNGQKRAVYQDCEPYLIDVINGKDNVAFRLYTLHEVQTNRLFEHEIRIFNMHYSSNYGFKHFVLTEGDDKFSDE